ncbi:UvrD-helicase domain-containing protein [Oceanimonas doudoroffii]|uniref:DNA 3'-5' helicase n=1 Tax=Oceanimonas doudoroffii TaxID=84158 RepID=G5CZG5_9GAMM|nr:UvrD-helicase domain-containing protein [Oceanimonas doudoroffii]AEQ39120.1 DNA helicase IV [Oceanimonas doudoroffii]OXY83459.1 DNA helicase IV [Oceanimonas doudoroffii]
MSICKAHWLGQLFSHPFSGVEPTDHGPVLHLRRERHPVPWQELLAPPVLAPGRLFRQLVLNCRQGQLVCAWLPKARAEALQRQLELGWFAHHAARVVPLAERCLALLESGYLRQSRWQQLQHWLAEEPLRWCDLTLPPSLDDRARAAFELVATLQQADDHWREQCQREHCEQVLQEHQALFDTLEAHPLTPAQRLACVTDEDHNLVLAGAGCGKTSVMAARTAFLLASGQAEPYDLLLLAFGNEAAAEMRERLARRPENAGVQVSTFHALGLNIITRATGCAPALSELAQSEAVRQRAFSRWLEQLAEDEHYGMRLLAWLRMHRFQTVPTPDFARLAREWAPLVAALKQYGEPEAPTPEQAEQLALVRPLLQRYQQRLAETGEIDFDDMIEQATALVRAGRFAVPWRHVLVDEFQDISRDRAELLLALRDAASELSLFCVGDDWQAIYRFSGADVSLTTDFAGFFGATAVTALDTTFRFNNVIERVASRFVTRNPHQLPKNLSTLERSDGPCVHVLPVADDERMDVVARLLGQIAAQRPNASVYLLSRFRFSLPDEALLAGWRKRFAGLHIDAQTLHGAKGKESDCVILLGLARGRYGFPPEKKQASLLDALLPVEEDYPHAEERRLFYVGLTRARDQVFLLADRQIPSPFVKELLEGGYPGVSRWQG